MSDFRKRLYEEHSQLLDRIEKLKSFILGELFESLPDIERKSLKNQLVHMEAYFDELNKRVSRLCNNA